MQKSKSVAYSYRGLSRDIPWQSLMREIEVCGDCDSPMALVITCTVAEGHRVPEFQGIDKPPPSPEKRPTIVDVARLAGVSIATVSRVLNNRGHASPETCARVRAVVEAVGFSLNETARALVMGRS